MNRSRSMTIVQRITMARLIAEGFAIRPDCLDCGEDILPARRQAVKNAVRCKECQDDHDKREVRRHG